MTDLSLLQERFPFLTVFTYSGEEFVGIIQNQSKNVVSVYVLNHLKDQRLRKKFLEYGDVWWNESNRKVPINLFLKEDFSIFNDCLKNFITKEFKIIHGPSISLQSLSQKRVKRKRIQLIRDDL